MDASHLVAVKPEANSERINGVTDIDWQLELVCPTCSFKETPSMSDCASCVILTGATGFLGVYMLQSLLKESEFDVICLVRAHNDERALQRVLETMKKFTIFDKALLPRITAA